jgi:hypothetical protein
MTDPEIIPIEINERLIHFKNEVKTNFDFLLAAGYVLKSMLTGRTENFLNYFCNFEFGKDNTLISIDYRTDIIKGQTIAFPEVKERPSTDNSISCFISDQNAFLTVEEFAENIVHRASKEVFWINLDSLDIKIEITRVVKNYSRFIQENLMDVVRQEKMYDCYTDRFYDKVFKEIHYR